MSLNNKPGWKSLKCHRGSAVDVPKWVEARILALANKEHRFAQAVQEAQREFAAG